MKKYIHAYVVGGQTLFTGLLSWSNDDLNGNKSMIFTYNQSEEGYENISSIENWEKYGDNVIQKRKQIKLIFEETVWENLSLNEKEIVARYFLVEKNLRDEVLTQQEQDDNNYFKIYNFLSEDVIEQRDIKNLFLTPKSIDYKQDIDGRFHPEYTFDSNGWLIKCVYHENLEISQDPQGFTQYSYSNPILEVDAVYTIKPDGYVGSRTITRKWYRLDGTLDPDSKVTEKFYEPMQARDEGKRRRRNLINELTIEAVGLFIMTSEDLNDVSSAEADAIPFLKEISSGISDYYEYGSKTDTQGNDFLLKEQILNSAYARLDNFVPETNDTVTIRQYLISKLDV
jgi:hypothetical protein